MTYTIEIQRDGEVIASHEAPSLLAAKYTVIEHGFPAKMRLAQAVRLLDQVTEQGGTVELSDSERIVVRVVS